MFLVLFSKKIKGLIWNCGTVVQPNGLCQMTGCKWGNTELFKTQRIFWETMRAICFSSTGRLVVHDHVLAGDLPRTVEDKRVCRARIATGRRAPDQKDLASRTGDTFLHMDDWSGEVACIKQALEEALEAGLCAVEALVYGVASINMVEHRDL